jgi:transcription termination factor Rho
VAAAALEQSILESKDKDTLLEMAKALGVKVNARLKKGEIIDKILDTTGSSSPGPTPAPAPVTAAVSADPSSTNGSAGAAPQANPNGDSGAGEATDDLSADLVATPIARSGSSTSAGTEAVVLGADGEPLADWEIALLAESPGESTDAAAEAGSASSSPASSDAAARDDDQGRSGHRNDGSRNDTNRNDVNRPDAGQNRNDGNRNRNDGNRNRNDSPGGQNQNGQNQNNQNRNSQNRNDDGQGGDADGNRRRRRRRKGRGGQEGPQGEDVDLIETDDLTSQPLEAVDVEGYLDIRDEGYGFLRVKGYLPSKEDAYIPLRLAKQYGLRKGDHLTGKVRPAGRNEKNPGLLEVYTVNGANPELAKRRPNFEDLTALFPDSKLMLEDKNDPSNMTARIIDLVSPIGKGQRGIIVSPPKAGKTTVMKTIAKSIELNNPEVVLIVLLIDERPEEVTDMRRSVSGEVISSTFDRPSDEHTHVAEMTIAKAKRLVEEGKDVVIMLDGITRLSRAYNLAAPASGKILSGGIDAGALYPPKRFFGAARNVEEGGSLTILATALVDTNSRMDEAIFEEFKGTGNMELRLDRKVAERRIYPAIDVDASSTRHEELLFDRKQLQQVWKLRRVLSGLAADGSAAAGLELLIDRLKTFRTNDEFLAEIAKQPSM